MAVPRLPNGASKISVTVDAVPIIGAAHVALNTTAPSSLVMIVGTPTISSNLTQTQVTDTFTTLHALAATT